jgi:hypothetical protein
MTNKIRVYQGQKYELATELKLKSNNVEIYVRVKE